MRVRQVLFEGGNLRLRLDDVDHGEGAGLHLPLVAGDLRLRLRQRLELHRHIPDGVRELPVRLLDHRQLLHRHLRQLRVGEIDGTLREQNLAPLQIDPGVSEQRRVNENPSDAGNCGFTRAN